MFIIMIIVFFSIFFLTISILKILFASKFEMLARIDAVKEYGNISSSNADEELQKPFLDRVIKPVIQRLSSRFQKIMPIKHKDYLEKKLMLSGSPWGLSSYEFITVYYTVILFTGSVGALIAYINSSKLITMFCCTILGMVYGLFMIEITLMYKMKNRQNAIIRELPDVLDLLTVSVEAGLGFDAALQKVIHKIKGPISLEFNKTLQEIKMGRTRKDALRDLGTRTGVEDINTFANAIIQADQLGVSIGNVLRIQSKQIRDKKRQRIEEKAMKAPIKMLLPMVFFIFPTLFLVLLGPAVIQLIENMR